MLSNEDEIKQIMDGVQKKTRAMFEHNYPNSKWTWSEINRMIIQASYRAHELR
jgi:hypothetical protein